MPGFSYASAPLALAGGSLVPAPLQLVPAAAQNVPPSVPESKPQTLKASASELALSLDNLFSENCTEVSCRGPIGLKLKKSDSLVNLISGYLNNVTAIQG